MKLLKINFLNLKRILESQKEHFVKYDEKIFDLANQLRESNTVIGSKNVINNSKIRYIGGDFRIGDDTIINVTNNYYDFSILFREKILVLVLGIGLTFYVGTFDYLLIILTISLTSIIAIVLFFPKAANGSLISLLILVSIVTTCLFVGKMIRNFDIDFKDLVLVKKKIIEITILDGQNNNVDMKNIDVALNNAKLLERNEKTESYSFELTNKNIDSLYFNISLIGVKFPYTVKYDKEKSYITYRLPDYVKNEDIEEVKELIDIEQINVANSGDTAIFNIAVIKDKRYYWAFDDEANVVSAELNGKKLDVCEVFSSKKSLILRLWTRNGLICVGNACEYPPQPLLNEKIAYQRAKSLADCFITSMSDKVKGDIYLLNLGQHKKSETKDIDKQRSIIIVGVVEIKEGTNKERALYKAFKKIQLPFNIDDFYTVNQEYSSFSECSLELYYSN